MSEWVLSNERISIGYKKLSGFIKTPMNKEIIAKTIENCVNSKEWPEKYYILRDEYLPELIGLDANAFLFWYIFSTGQDVLEKVSMSFDERVFLKYLGFNYVNIFMKAKLFNDNPLGFYELRYTFFGEGDTFNLNIYRNDGEKFGLRCTTEDIFKMYGQAFYYLSMMMEANNHGQWDKAQINANIIIMKESIDNIHNIINTEEQQDE